MSDSICQNLQFIPSKRFSSLKSKFKARTASEIGLVIAYNLICFINGNKDEEI